MNMQRESLCNSGSQPDCPFSARSLTMRVSSLISLAPVCAAVLLACGKQTAGADTSSSGAQPAGAAAAPATPAANAADTAPASTPGAPAGYVIRTDDASASPADAKYTTEAGRIWDVQTGPAHIIYRASDTASGSYTLQTQIDQLAAPHHPEAYGVFFGGQDLAGAGQRYTYFIVRGNGMYAIKARDGAAARTVVDFTASPNVPTANAAGKATYAITVRVAPDSVRFLVNDKPVTAIATSRVGVAGIAGIRVNHHLHVGVTPLVIGR
jgi:hypothetical protein